MAPEPDPELFREVFGRFATGVAVITSAGPAGAGGMTANALCSLSLDPLLALVCFENQARTLPIVREAGRFARQPAGRRPGASWPACSPPSCPRAEKLDGVAHRLEHGVPVIEGSLAWAICELQELIAGGDHTIAIGRVLSMGLGDGEPLLWYSGRYHDRALAPVDGRCERRTGHSPAALATRNRRSHRTSSHGRRSVTARSPAVTP